MWNRWPCWTRALCPWGCWGADSSSFCGLLLGIPDPRRLGGACTSSHHLDAPRHPSPPAAAWPEPPSPGPSRAGQVDTPSAPEPRPRPSPALKGQRLPQPLWQAHGGRPQHSRSPGPWWTVLLDPHQSATGPSCLLGSSPLAGCVSQWSHLTRRRTTPRATCRGEQAAVPPVPVSLHFMLQQLVTSCSTWGPSATAERLKHRSAATTRPARLGSGHHPPSTPWQWLPPAQHTWQTPRPATLPVPSLRSGAPGHAASQATPESPRMR